MVSALKRERNHRNYRRVNMETKKFTCSQCMACYPTAKELKEHAKVDGCVAHDSPQETKPHEEMTREHPRIEAESENGTQEGLTEGHITVEAAQTHFVHDVHGAFDDAIFLASFDIEQ